MSKQIRHMPNEKAIREYWATRLMAAKWYASEDEIREHGRCFACAIPESETFRSHIKARVDGGSDTVDNLHMLCHVCHTDSEYLDGAKYWHWFRTRTMLDAVLSNACRRGVNIFGDVLPRVFMDKDHKENGSTVEQAVRKMMSK